MVARRERLRKDGGRIETGEARDEGEFSYGSRVKLHLRDPYSLHVMSYAYVLVSYSPRKRTTTSGDLHNN